MNMRRYWFAAVAGAALVTSLLALTLVFVGVNPFVANAQTTSPLTVSAGPGTGGQIIVVGEGTVSIKPDTAQSTIGVEVAKPTVKEASAEAQTLMTAVLAALKKAGIADKDIQTSGYNVFADRSYGPQGPSEEVTYRVSNNVTVTIRDLDTVGDVLDAAIEAGANNIYGVGFMLSDTAKAASEARAKAVADANAKAKELAGLGGMTLGSIVNISEIVGNTLTSYSSNFRAAASEGLGGGSPISPGELELTMQLQITYTTK